ncbi:ATP-binding protein [Paractinoplanes atraurantiacus]|uniref:histidine kinase n=1 Tax=Paractinoplanes atraurantiacus TaxID=1036182 RepID=A0A285KP11_9ACTN|nr:PAS domain-containing sensor histidine kinase [Actinoplanes atraurantiacus]SNY73031.1 PAS domain S-box-containing protein [Actinoplanes atraurantiacus]
MPEQLYLLANLVIMVAYAGIMVAIVVPVSREGQLRSNRLALATALIFFSCAVGHGLHAWTAYRAIVDHTGHLPGWELALWDALTAAVGVYYWSLRRSYGVLLGPGAMYVSPGEEKRLAEARSTLAAVVEYTDDAIIGLGMGGLVTAWNGGAERLFGYRADEIIGQPVSILADDTGFAEQQEVRARIAAGERGVYYEARRLHKDGSPVEVSLNVAPIQEVNGVVTGVSVVARDIRQAREAAERQRALEERTHQAQRMESLGKLAGGIAHDFNNILAIIVNYTEFAIEESESNPGVRADLTHVRTAADRAMGLTRQLLTFTRGDTVQPQDVDLNLALAEVRDMLERTIGEHITLVARPAPAPVVVRADPGQLQQILLNLAINARDAMPDGGSLVLEAGTAELDGDEVKMQPALPAGRYARLQISDTGEGMPPEVVQRIFEPFFTTKPRGRGTGLGLSTVYGIVTEAGGALNVYSEPGVGTTFRIYLPLAAVTGEAAVAARPAAPPPGDGRTILVVEDEIDLARVVTRILTAGGYHVLLADSAPHALELFAERPCDALLTDVIMPEMSGPRLAELIHQQRPDLPVVYMSGYSNGLLGETRVLDPGIPFVEKPFTRQDLLHKVHDALVPARVAP